MARVTVEDDTDIVVHLAPWEKLAARRGDIRVPVTALREVHLEPDWWRALRGLRGRGLWIPDRIAVGIRVLPDGEDFAAIRAGHPVVCLELRRTYRFARVSVHVTDTEGTLRALEPYVPRDRLA
ncbi:hypothetical protein AB0C77_38245 [Streptomyces sp. NPDC048629]|uniref:hypothetical protein n=1 Tax=Streptomyces sp. NPDC048629 TaxID=3154824 RepID=UPI00341B93DE